MKEGVIYMLRWFNSQSYCIKWSLEIYDFCCFFVLFFLLLFFFVVFFSSCSVYYRYIYITYILQVKNMKLLKVGDPSIHTSLKLILADKKTQDNLISYNVISATKNVPPDPKSYSLPCSGNRTAELNKAIISLTCRQFNSKSCSAMQLSKLRQEGCGASEAPEGAITHKIKLNVIIDYWRKRVLCVFAPRGGISDINGAGVPLGLLIPTL